MKLQKALLLMFVLLLAGCSCNKTISWTCQDGKCDVKESDKPVNEVK